MCKTNHEKFEKDKVYSVSEFVTSQLLNTKCDSTSEIEQENVNVRGKFSLFDYTPGANQIILFDLINNDHFIELRYPVEIQDAIAQKLQIQDGSQLLVNGKVIGYNQRKNFNCKRVYYLQLNRPSDILIV